MGYVNNYVPPVPKPATLPNPAEPYDVNFCYPVKELESDRVKLAPFIPRLHAAVLFDAISTNLQTMHYMPFSIPSTFERFELFCEEFIRLDPGKVMYVILDKAKLGPGVEEDPDKVKEALLGTISYFNSSAALSIVEVALVIILPQYQRTHVNTHAVGLLLQYALDLPKDGGLGVRRVQWHAHANNGPSIKAAERLGYKLEGIIRWQRTLPAEKESSAPLRSGDPLSVPGRHAAILAICWDDWENGVREQIRGLMERR